MVDSSHTQTKSLKIDIHHHIFPPAHFYPKSELNIQKGWRTPAENFPWTPRKSIEAMDKLGIELAVLSFPADVPLREEYPSESHGDYKTQARELNELAWRTSEEYQGRFGWMAFLGDLRDTNGMCSRSSKEAAAQSRLTKVFQWHSKSSRTRWTRSRRMVSAWLLPMVQGMRRVRTRPNDSLSDLSDYNHCSIYWRRHV